MRNIYKSYRFTLLPLLFMLWFAPNVLGQEVKYVYDAAGNRTQRVINLPKTRSAETETDAWATLEMPRYEDMLGERKVIIYPNPTRGMIRIEFQGYGDIENGRLLLYDIQGRLLRQVNNVESSVTLDLTPYPAGIYILHLMAGFERSEWKIIKE